jgi:hypothetical protein
MAHIRRLSSGKLQNWNKRCGCNKMLGKGSLPKKPGSFQ